MRAHLPDGHGLPQSMVESEFVTRDGTLSLTDVQFEALCAGVAKGSSVLVTAPTSSGKTGVAVFAISGWLARHQAGLGRAVYLLSHRALAREKFIEFRDRLAPLLGIGPEEVVFAIGDLVTDGNGDEVPEPLAATILVATYEKYLGLLSSSGSPGELSGTCFVLDEFQLIGDESRGQDVEILLTLLRRARAGQLVGLCAMLDPDDGRDIAEWLAAREVRVAHREVELVYELRLPGKTLCVSTNNPEELVEGPGAPTDTVAILRELLADPSSHAPIAVFCTTRKQVFDLAEAWNGHVATPSARQLAFVFDEETSSSRDLGSYLPKAFAFHTADLVETEREAVENALRENSLQLVFATTTLAYGLNFSFKTVLIHSWERNRDRVSYPIPAAEFHNMAGRAGRLSLAESGRAIFTAATKDHRKAMAFLDISRVDRIESRIQPERFDQLALQLLSAGMVADRDGLVDFLNGTMSAARERRRDLSFDERWPRAVDEALTRLHQWGFVNSRLAVTAVGRKVAASGILPGAADELLRYLSRSASTLGAAIADGATGANDVEFALIHACLCSSDFTKSSGGRRNLPWQIDGHLDSPRARRTEQWLFHRPWHSAAPSANGADLAVDWVQGCPIVDLESRFRSLRGGDLNRLFADIGQVLVGWADVAMAASAPSLRPEDRTPSMPDPDDVRDEVRQVIAAMRIAARRLVFGVPEHVLWLAELVDSDARRILTRPGALALGANSLTDLNSILDGSRKNALIDALRKPYGPQKAPGKAESVRSAAERYRLDATERKRQSQIRRAGSEWAHILGRIYDAEGTAFEDAVNDALIKLGVTVSARDERGKIRFPDFVLDLPAVGAVVLECKTKAESNACVDLGAATEVCGKASTHGYDDAYQVTLCRPYVGPDVLRTLNSKRLAVVNCEDFSEVIVRIATGRATVDELADWLAQPGVVTLDSLGGGSAVARTRRAGAAQAD